MVDVLDGVSILVLVVIPLLTGIIAGVFRQLPTTNDGTHQEESVRTMFHQGLQLSVLPAIVLFVILSVTILVLSVVVGYAGGRPPVSFFILQGIVIVLIVGASVGVFTISGGVLGVLHRN